MDEGTRGTQPEGARGSEGGAGNAGGAGAPARGDASTSRGLGARPKSKRRPIMRTIVRVLLWVVVLGAIVGALVLAYRPRPVLVDVATVRRGTLKVSIEEDGRTRLRGRYQVSSPLGGRVMRVTLRPGDKVKEGDPLATIVPAAAPLLDVRTIAESEARLHAAGAGERVAKTNVERARTALDLAKSELERTQKLADSGAITRAELDRVAGEVRLRQSELASAQFGALVSAHERSMAAAVLERSQPKQPAQKDRPAESMLVTSPVSGTVLRVDRESEGVVAPGTPLLEVGDTKNLEIVVDVLTADAVHVRPGMPVVIERWGGPTALRAHVRLVEPSATTRLSALGVEEQRVNVLIDLDEAPEVWASLGDGYRVEARIVTRELADALLVPSGSVFRKGESWAVFVLGAGGKAELREITIAARTAREVAIDKGLAEGERIVLHPSDRVAAGVAIAPR
jgi:HlyD family secretion protein